MMNRRAFLKLFVGTAAVATIPIPKFLFPKEEKIELTIPETGPLYYNIYRTQSASLTAEMIEEAAQLAAKNCGTPDHIYMNTKAYKTFAKYFSYRIEYV